MILEDTITNAFITLIKNGVGNQLATIKLQTGTTPAVVKARSSKNTPDQPYIVVSLLDIESVPQVNNRSYREIDDTVSYERIEHYLYSFRCYGTNSIHIMRNLHAWLDIPSTRDYIRTSTGGALYSLENPDNLPVRYKDGYLESSSFSLIWESYNSINDPSTGVIETVTLIHTKGINP